MDNDSFSIDENYVRFTQPEIALSIGYRAIARQFFRQQFPSPYEMEMAIATIEDSIQATPELHHIAQNFACADSYLKEIARIAGREDCLTQEELEHVFNRIADVVSGSPMHEGEFQENKNFISYLLIARELSHHLNIQKISLR